MAFTRTGPSSDDADEDAMAIAAEREDLLGLAARLCAHAPQLENAVKGLSGALDAALAGAAGPAEAEQAAESFGHDLRRLWLKTVAGSAGAVYRSPTQNEIDYLARTRSETFGYERDLQPEALEQRCAKFFPSPPGGWRHDHILFSSGQAALSCLLLALGDLDPLKGARPLRIAHLGAYFETRALIESLQSLFEPSAPDNADVIIAEPICCGGAFVRRDVEAELAKLRGAPPKPQLFIFDTTLMGSKDNVAAYLGAIATRPPIAVLRLNSGLKLFQAGLELSNVGIVSVYTTNGDAGFGRALRRMRTLTGAGLRFADVAALEAPWFLDPVYTRRYEEDVFANNAALARAAEDVNQLFEPIVHPAFWGAAAPYCVFQLRMPDDAAYQAIETWIAREAEKRGLNIDRGGSFGFRGHRFEIVRPETGDPTFLRVALGRRGGFSCRGAIALMAALASRKEPPA